MKPIRLMLLWLLLALLLLPTLTVAEQSPEPTASEEETAEPAARVSIGDAQKEEREKAHDKILHAAHAPGIFVADANDLSLAFFTRAEHDKFSPASTTKIMTALLILENGDVDDVAVAPHEATSQGGSNTLLGMSKNEAMRVEDLLYGMMLVSGNDCAVTLAFYLSGTEEAFVKRMNERAEQLGMENTKFSNASGKARDDNHSTPYDMALVTQEAMKNELFRTIVASAQYTVPKSEWRKKETVITNSNHLVSDKPGTGAYYPYAIGVKTGTTGLGNCLVAAAKKEDVTVLCVQLGLLDDSSFSARRAELFRRAREMFEYVFTYEYVEIDAKTMLDGFTLTVPVENAAADDPEQGALALSVDPSQATAFRAIREIDAILNGDSAFAVTTDVSATAPIKAGERLGTATFSYHGRDWFTLPLLASRDVAEFVPTPEPTEVPTPAPTVTPTPFSVTEETSAPTPGPTAAPEPEEPSLPMRGVLILGLSGALILLLAAVIVLAVKRRRDRS